MQPFFSGTARGKIRDSDRKPQGRREESLDQESLKAVGSGGEPERHDQSESQDSESNGRQEKRD